MKDVSLNTSGFVPKDRRGHQWKFQEMVTLTGADNDFNHPFFVCTKCDMGCIAYPEDEKGYEDLVWVPSRHTENGWEFHMNGVWCRRTMGFDKFVQMLDICWDLISTKATVVIRLCGQLPSQVRLKVGVGLIRVAMKVLKCKVRFEYEE